MAKTENRQHVINKCVECNNELRPIEKNIKTTPSSLGVKRFCKTCRKHVETKDKK